MNQAFETVSVEYKMTGRSGSEFVFNTNVRHGVTPAEFRVLENIHGRGNVRAVSEELGQALEKDGYSEVKHKGEAKLKEKFRFRTNDEEIDRLRSWYGKKAFSNVYGVENEFPHLPYTFSEARIPVSIPDNVRSIAQGRDRTADVGRLSGALDGPGEGEAGNG